MVAKTFQLAAQSREITGKKVKRLRSRQLLPAVVYGHGVDGGVISIDSKEFKKIFGEAGTSALVDLAIDDKKPLKVLITEPQTHYLSGEPVHVDFYAVKMTEKIETAIPIHFVGVSPAVDELEGNFISSKDELNIKCFPGDLIPAVEVDISVLATFDDSIRVSDLKVPETIEVMDDPEEVVALVQEQRSEAEIEEELSADVTGAEEAAVAELGKEETDGDAAEAAGNDQS
jgi:large subunit ribosomal protein L25